MLAHITHQEFPLLLVLVSVGVGIGIGIGVSWAVRRLRAGRPDSRE